MNLLIADDEEELLENLEYDLSKSVSKIITVENGAKALKILKEQKIDCVLSDINMPQKNGIVMAKEAREWGYNLPIIFLTAHGDSELMKKALSLGAFDFIDKPYDKDSLVKILSEASKESEALQNSMLTDQKLDTNFQNSYLNLIKK